MRLTFSNVVQKNFIVEFLPAGKAGIPRVKRIGIFGLYSPGLAPEIGSRSCPGVNTILFLILPEVNGYLS
jgi:hypothetical protein